MSKHTTDDKRPEGEPPEGAAGPPSGPTDDLDALRAELARKEAERAENLDKFLRASAELENVKRRFARERAETVRYAVEQLVRDLVPVVDSLERALGCREGGGDGQPFVDGVALVIKDLLAALERHGVTQIRAQGECFDPTRHEAMAQVETSEHPPNTVVEEHHRGYLLHDRLLRPALVTVAKAPSSAPPATDQGDPEVEKGGKRD